VTTRCPLDTGRIAGNPGLSSDAIVASAAATACVPIERLTAHRERQKFERKWAGSRWQEHGLVFTTTIGTPLDSANVTHNFQKALQAAGLRKQQFHDLRHCAATLLLAQGVGLADDNGRAGA
jgi:integrase